eukprot:GILJ01038239.1.p1 GENE.GILJ01038239.1~~GILJ01038239.1.p1  ORF type:complete len:125 (-),score=13.99 GILJ01038239.1:69-443(-)
MTAADLKRFENEGGVWGRQRVVRRKQLNLTLGIAGFSTLAGAWHAKSRHNTPLILASTAPISFLFGLIVGHAIAKTVIPNVADNKETTMMRRTWWAKECAKSWDFSQVNGDQWKAKYPHSKLGF